MQYGLRLCVKPPRGFPDDLQPPENGILFFWISQKLFAGNTTQVTLDRAG